MISVCLCDSLPTECEDPSPVNGNALYPNGKTFGEVAFVSCDNGYGLVGNMYVSCLAGRVWSSNTTCERGVFSWMCKCPIEIYYQPWKLYKWSESATSLPSENEKHTLINEHIMITAFFCKFN